MIGQLTVENALLKKALSRLEATLVLSALERALSTRNVQPGMIHHSDRGVQISMSRRGNPCDNAYAENFMKTLKYEEVYLNEYEDLHNAYHRIKEFLDDYNQTRLHSALGYLPPAEFEALAIQRGLNG